MTRHFPLILTLLVAVANPLCWAAPPQPACEELIRTMQRGSTQEREQAAVALGKRPADAGQSVPAILEAFRVERQKSVRMSLHSALVELGAAAVPQICAALPTWPEARLGDLVVVLAVIGPEADAAVPQLKELQHAKDVKLRQIATFALHNIRPEPKSKIQLVGGTDEVEANDETEPATAGASSIRTAASMREEVRPLFAPPDETPKPIAAKAASTVPHEDDLRSAEKSEPKPIIEQAAAVEPPAVIEQTAAKVESDALEATDAPDEPARIAAAAPAGPTALETFRAKTITLWGSAQAFADSHQTELKTLGQWIALGYAGWMIVFLLMPVLFVESELLLRSRRSVAGRVFLFWMPLLRAALLLPWLGRSRYAVSAWLNARSAEMTRRFWDRPETQRHSGYVAAPLRWNGELRPQLVPRALRTLGRTPGLVLIGGASGSGKSALAIELAAQSLGGGLARTRLLPVFVGADDDVASAVSEQVRELVGISASDAESFRPLLRRLESRCVLVCLDEQEDAEAVRGFVRATRSIRGGRPLTIVATGASIDVSADVRLEPVAPTGERLKQFVSDFVARRSGSRKTSEAERTQLLGAATSLRAAGPLPMTALVLCLEDFVACRAGEVTWKPARSIVEVLRRHIDRQLAQATGFGFTPDELRRDLDELVRMATARAFRPQALRYDAVVKRLPGPTTARRLAFLEQQAQLIEVTRGDDGMVRFQSNQLALRLAAEARRETLDLSDSRWTAFVHQFRMAAQGESTNVKPFAAALYDCCVASAVDRPESVLADLGQLAGLDAARVERDLHEQQMDVAVAGLGARKLETQLKGLQRMQGLALRSDRALSTLIDAAGSPDADLGDEAAELLVELGGSIVGPLCTYLGGDDTDARLRVIGLLQRIGAPARPALPGLMQALEDRDNEVRGAAIAAIAAIAPDELPPLEGLLQDDAAAVRAECALAFGTLGAAAESVTPAIQGLLDDESEHVRLAAVRALGQIGLASVDVATGLIKALVDPNPEVSQAARHALTQLRGQPDAISPRARRREAALAGSV